MHLSSNPWLSIWLHPRDTTEALMKTPPSRVRIFLMTTLLGYSYSFDTATAQLYGFRYELSFILIGSLFAGIISGFLYWYIISRMIQWVGKWLGGQGTWKEVQTGTLYASIPFIAKLGVVGLQMLFFGITVFQGGPPDFVEKSVPLGIVWDGLILLHFVLVLWYAVTLSKAVAVAHHFSGWRGFLTAFISFSVIVIIPYVLSVALFSSTGA